MSFHTQNSLTSLSLLARARARDSEAWERLVRLYSPLVFYWARQGGLKDQSAADLVQDVWASVSSNLDRFRRDSQSGSFRAWLWTIARNKLRDHFRRYSGHAAAAGGTDARMLMESLPESEPVSEVESVNNQLLQRALDMIRGDFESRTWQAFWQMTVEDLPAAVVGQRLNMAANAVHQARFRVLRRLREEMEGLVEAPIG
jgi:RNA polymerase sigma-70 factor (ECF subfamily)